MKWLQWSSGDLEGGLGGVEVHARNLHQEFLKMGHESVLSSDPQALKDSKWDVIHTHGSGTPIFIKKSSAAVRVHTLHGTTLGRMKACREWTWPGGYVASNRELLGVLEADVVFAVQPHLWLYRLARAQGKVCQVCLNGWDYSGSENSALPPDVIEKLKQFKKFWLFLGRGSDPVKGVDQLKEMLKKRKDFSLVAVPGEGFEDTPSIVSTGRLNSAQIQTILQLASGLLAPSRYEGLPLVVLESLGQGIPVVTTRVGGIPHLQEKFGDQLLGLVTIPRLTPQNILEGIEKAEKYDTTQEARKERQRINQSVLPSWGRVAREMIQTVEEFRRGRENA